MSKFFWRHFYVICWLLFCRWNLWNHRCSKEHCSSSRTWGPSELLSSIASSFHCFGALTTCEEDDSHKIGELPSTAICGNDITASCLAPRRLNLRWSTVDLYYLPSSKQMACSKQIRFLCRWRTFQKCRCARSSARDQWNASNVSWLCQTKVLSDLHLVVFFDFVLFSQCLRGGEHSTACSAVGTHVPVQVVTALPLNGGIYNLLLNSSTKQCGTHSGFAEAYRYHMYYICREIRELFFFSGLFRFVRHSATKIYQGQLQWLHALLFCRKTLRYAELLAKVTACWISDHQVSELFVSFIYIRTKE